MNTKKACDPGNYLCPKAEMLWRETGIAHSALMCLTQDTPEYYELWREYRKAREAYDNHILECALGTQWA